VTTYTSPEALAAIAQRGNPHASTITPNRMIAKLCADTLELNRLRTVLASLPDDDWHPDDFERLAVEQNTARAALEESS
jgi:hypothetical protein